MKLLKSLKPKSEFSRNILTLMTGTTIAQAIPVAISPILTRLYTPEDFGTLALFVAITGVFSVIASGRYELALMLPSKDEDVMNIFALGLMIILLVSLGLFVFIFFFNDHLVAMLNNDTIGYWIYFVPLAVFFTGLFNLLSYFNNRKKYYRDIADATIIKSVVLATIQIGVGFIKAGPAGLISGQISSSFVANTKLLRNILQEKKLLNKVTKLKMLALAKRYKNFPKFQAPHALLNTFSAYIPIYMFTPFFGLTAVGLYALSTRIVLMPMMILAGASAKVYNQKITELYNENEDAYGFTIRFLKSLFTKSIIPFLIIVIFAPDIFGFVFGIEWREAGVYAQILSPWLWMAFLVTTFSFIPSLLNLQRKALILEVIYTLLRIIAIGVGLWFHSIYIALFGYAIVGFVMLSYNSWWMLSSLKKVS